MHSAIKVAVAVILVVVAAPVAHSQSPYLADRIDTGRTTFVLQQTLAVFVWASEWTSGTVLTYGDKNVIFKWYFKDGTVGYAFNGDYLRNFPLTGYSGTNSYTSLEDINRNPIQPMTLSNFPVKVELYLGQSGSGFSMYVPQILIDTVCFAEQSIQYNQTYRFSRTGCLSDPWPMVGRDAQHTGRSPFLGPQILGTPRITTISSSIAIQIESAIVVDRNGVLYIAGNSTVDTTCRVYAFNADGSLRPGWPFAGPAAPSPSGSIWGSPAIGPDGTIYAACGKGLYAFNPDGTQKWPNPFSTGSTIFTSPLVAPDGTVYVTSSDTFLYAVRPDGTQKWKVAGFIGGDSALGTDGTIFAHGGPTVFQTGGLTALNPDGSVKWASAYGFIQIAFSPPTVAADGTVYTVRHTLLTGPNTTLLALDPSTGAIKYQRQIPAWDFSPQSPLAILPDGTVVYASNIDANPGGTLFGLSPDLSTIRFSYPGSLHLITRPAIGSDGSIYFVSYSDGPLGSEQSKIIALSPDGSMKSEFTLVGVGQLTSGAMAGDGTLHFGSRCCASNGTIGRLYAFAGPPQPPPPPLKGVIRGSIFVLSGQTIFGASVTVNPGNLATTSGPDGSYVVAVGPGLYTVTASAAGYSSDTESGVVVLPGASTTVNLMLGSPLVAGAFTRGQGLLKFIASVLKITIQTILEILHRGLGRIWEAILAALDIRKGVNVADDLKDPAWWAGFYDEVYKLGKPQAKRRIDDCVTGILGGGKTWSTLASAEKRDQELQFCLINSKGYPSGTLAPAFMSQWLQ